MPKFSGVHSLDLHLSGNTGAEATAVTFIGLKGDFTPVQACSGCLLRLIWLRSRAELWAQAKREAVQAVYESTPLAADHKVRDEQLGRTDLA